MPPSMQCSSKQCNATWGQAHTSLAVAIRRPGYGAPLPIIAPTSRKHRRWTPSGGPASWAVCVAYGEAVRQIHCVRLRTLGDASDRATDVVRARLHAEVTGRRVLESSRAHPATRATPGRCPTPWSTVAVRCATISTPSRARRGGVRHDRTQPASRLTRAPSASGQQVEQVVAQYAVHEGSTPTIGIPDAARRASTRSNDVAFLRARQLTRRNPRSPHASDDDGKPVA